MNILAGAEFLAIVVAAWWLWRRTPVTEPRYGRVMAIMTLALTIQLALVLLTDSLLGGLRGADNPDAWVFQTALGVFAIQMLRALMLAWALRMWLLVVKPRLVRSWRGVLVLIGVVLAAIVPDVTFPFVLLMLPALLRLNWTAGARGWTRVLLLIVFGVLALGLAADVSMVMSDGKFEPVSTLFGTRRSPAPLSGDLPQPAAAIAELTRPFGHASRVMVFILQLQLAVGFFQLLVFPIRLRGLSLKRRFTVTLAMYRFIPGTLAFLFLVVVVYLGIGLHRASVARSMFTATLENGMGAAEELLATGARAPEPPDWNSGAPDGAFAVARELDWIPATNDTSNGGDTIDAHWSPSVSRASSGTPGTLLESNYFEYLSDDSTIGFVERNGTLYLRAAKMLKNGNTARAAEVFVVVGDAYLARVATRIGADVRIDVSPNIFVQQTSVTLGGQNDPRTRAWVDSAFTLSARIPRDTSRADFWEQNVYLARTFLPMGNWLAPLSEDDRIGAVQLKLYTTPRGLFETLTNDTFIITSQAFAVLILITIGLLFLLVELSAVRTGRSIIKGIVSDVKTLADAARQFGQGDLRHRIMLEGKDEMGQLAQTFNRMASDIEAHQAVLLEKERLEADLSVARDIQQRMLPQGPPAVPGLDVAGLSIPSREVGGDLFYFLPLSRGRLGLTVGDVSGKSVPAALLMSNVLAALKSEARLVEHEDEIVAHLNKLIVEQVEPGRFVTFFYGVVNPGERILRYACAGHNPPLLMHATGEAEWLQEAGAPLGVMAESTYVPVETTLVPGDVLVLYSDGVTEAQRASDMPEDDDAPPDPDEFFDEHRLETAVRDARDKSATETIGHVMDAITAFTDGAEQSDDLTLVVVRITA